MGTTMYQYQVRDKAGKIVSGTIEADSQGAVAQKLSSLGYATVSITEHKAGMKTELKIPGFGGSVKLKDLAVMSRQFATMIGAGLSLMRALNILSEQTPNKLLASVLAEVRNSVENGNSLSSALAEHPRIFPPLMVNMIRAGEVGGFLDGVLLRIASNYEDEVRLKGKIKSAMTYPVVVFIMAMLAVTGMLLFIVPIFKKMFEGLGAQLPAPTLILVKLSAFLRAGAPFIIVFIIVGVVLWKRFKHTERVHNFLDPIKLKIPVFGPLFQKIALSRFTRNFGTMLHAGVPILQALDIVADTSGNVVVARAVRDVQDSVRNGESLTEPLTHHAIFPPMVVQMLSVGEDTGALDSMLEKISEFYDQEVESTTESLTALIEPLMIAVLGGIVGSMIIALYMPIFKIFDLIK